VATTAVPSSPSPGSTDRRAQLALTGFGLWHLPILLGIIGIAFGLERAVDDPYRVATTAVAIGLGVGTATFLAGDVLFRRTLGILDNHWRLAAAALAVASIPLATGIAPAAQIGALAIAVGGAQTLEHRLRRPPGRTT
jgi:low temperature requirement protein LtrA